MSGKSHRGSFDFLDQDKAATKYVCKAGDLDKLLNDELKDKFQALFPNPSSSEDKSAWRMYYKGSTPEGFLDRFGIKFENPTVRDAVAFDLVKLDDDSVSNDSVYTYPERIGYSQMEYERHLLNRNFRIHLVNLEPEWSNIGYYERPNDDQIEEDMPELEVEKEEENDFKKRCVKRTVDRMYQGVKMSETLLSYFESIFGNMEHPEQVYVPFTNANDFTTEISLIPNTHPDFRPVTSRAYYDNQYSRYRGMLKKHGINMISSFALVDPYKDKNHTGEFLVKVQRKISDNDYRYIVAKIDVNGHVIGTPITFTGANTILCVCQDDFYSIGADGKPQDRQTRKYVGKNVWPTPGKGIADVPMVKSTTSSHYSIFRQRIPEYDLKQVRHYLQFKNRLEGMELELGILKRNVYGKEIQASECFAKETMVLGRLFKEFSKNQKLMELVIQYYDLMAEWDALVMKRTQVSGIRDDKLALLETLVAEYNSITTINMVRKLELGQKIHSLKLEITKSLDQTFDEIQNRIQEIIQEVETINAKIDEINHGKEIDFTQLKSSLAKLHEAATSTNEKDETTMAGKKRKYNEKKDKATEKYDTKPSLDTDALDDIKKSDQDRTDWDKYQENKEDEVDDDPQYYPRDFTDEDRPPIQNIETDKLHKLVLQSERWRGFMLGVGYELNQLKKMETICEDATIKVRRLVHNFAERMENVEADVWNDSHALRDDFSFTGMASSSLREIILLHDWYAVNAPGKTPEDMGFTGEDKDAKFLEFRKRCNKIAYNLRKNQYAQMLALKKDKVAARLEEVRAKIANKDTLKYDDKYGEEAQTKEKKQWSLNDVTKEQKDKTALFIEAEKVIEEQKPSDAKLDIPEKRKADLSVYPKADSTLADQEKERKLYEMDASMMVERTVNYLKSIGIIDTEDDIEKLVARNKALHYEGDVYSEIQKLDQLKSTLDTATGNMMSQRDAMKSIIGRITDAERKIVELKAENKRIFNSCIMEKNKQTRNRMILDKIDNENKIVELKAAIKAVKGKHYNDFSTLERLRATVDSNQASFKKAVKQFKEKIGLNQEAIDRLMVGIYNMFQEEILNREGN